MHRLFIILVFLSWILVACSEEDSPSTPPAELETVRIQLAWTYDYSSTPFYVAVEQGFFASEGLDVTLVEGGFGEGGYIEPLEEVVNGDVQFGITSATGIIAARANQEPAVGILSILQRDPYAIISLPDSNLIRPKDLSGKIVAISAGSAMHNVVAMLKNQNIDLNSVNIVPRTEFGVTPLLNGEVDALGGWIINEGVEVQEAGYEPNYILLTDYGGNAYSIVLFTTEEIITQRPELVQKVVKSVLRGLDEVIRNPRQAVDYILKYNPDLDRDGQERRLLATVPLMNAPNIPLGSMSPEVWESVHQVMLNNVIITEPIEIEKAYNLSFLEAASE